jgi:hypothetical protein
MSAGNQPCVAFAQYSPVLLHSLHVQLAEASEQQYTAV